MSITRKLFNNKILLGLFIFITLMITSCTSKTWVCTGDNSGGCGKSFSGDAYYTFSASIDRVMCEDCARKYWMPLDYRIYAVTSNNNNNNNQAQNLVSTVPAQEQINSFASSEIITMGRTLSAVYTRGSTVLSFDANGYVSMTTDGFVFWDGTYVFTNDSTIKATASRSNWSDNYFTLSEDEAVVRLHGTQNIYIKDGDIVLEPSLSTQQTNIPPQVTSSPESTPTPEQIPVYSPVLPVGVNSGTIIIKGDEYNTDLTELYLIDKELNDDDIKQLQNMPQLTYLVLHANNITSLDSLSSLVNLTYLDLSHNEILNITPLANLVNLKHLNLWGNYISDISSLGSLKNLEILNIGSNNISDISYLNTLHNLNDLMIRYNNINEILPLQTLVNLKTLYIIGCSIPHSQIELLSEKLPYCSIED